MLVAVLVCFACGGDDDPEVTFGELCEDVGAEWCSRALGCGLLAPGTSMAECEFNWLAGCCAQDGLCDDYPSDRPRQSEIDACVEDLHVYPCDDLASGTAPVSCIN